MMSAAHLGIVWNPSKTSRDELEAAVKLAVMPGADGGDTEPVAVSWHETSVDDPGRSAARAALVAGATVVAAAGGDGTVRAVAEELAASQADADLAVIPLGTGNLLARNLGVPLGDLDAAFARATTAVAQPLDVGWVELSLSHRSEPDAPESDAPQPSQAQPYAFTVMAGFGIDAHMITETNSDLKDRAGWIAYLESMGRAVAASDLLQLQVSFDGEPSRTESAHTLMVGNCGSVQGGMTLMPDADPRDGRLDALVLSAAGLGGWLDTARNLVWENGVKRLLGASEEATSTDSTTHRQLRTLRVTLPEPRVCEVDGDDVGEADRIEFSVQPAAIRVR